MADKKVSLGWSKVSDKVYATLKSQAGRKLGEPIDITPEFLGFMVEYLRHRGGAVTINERVDHGSQSALKVPLGSAKSVDLKVTMAGPVHRKIKIQIVEDVLVEADPKEAQTGKDGGV
jgi:hypothetical protein